MGHAGPKACNNTYFNCTRSLVVSCWEKIRDTGKALASDTDGPRLKGSSTMFNAPVTSPCQSLILNQGGNSIMNPSYRVGQMLKLL